jgi:outer membrane receptor protein involved in Fe transport
VRFQAGLRVAIALILPVTMYCQTPTGEIRLEVKDPSGADMQASGELENLANGGVKNFQTDTVGTYTFFGLAFGRYRLEISREGFATQSLLIDVQSGTPISRTVTMALGMAPSTLDVVGTTPLAGGDLSPEQIPAPVQIATQEDLKTSGSLDLSDFLNRRLGDVNINENQGNPFQPDVNYRGYTASPLLGTPEGLSVYMDGVRLNQPFGDVVSWDLIPRIAISEVTLIPGSNPMFGLNTLGGALSLETRDGHTNPGAMIQISGGSFGRRAVEGEYGGASQTGWNWYVAGNLFHEDGWRIQSPSDVRQAFGKVGWQRAKTVVSLSFAYGDNSLYGNGLQEQRLLAENYASGYTYGDITTNRSPFFNLGIRHAATSALTFSGNAYFRYIRADAINTNLNNNSLDQSVYQPTPADQAALAAAGYTGFPVTGANASNTPFPFWPCLGQVLQRAQPINACDGIIINSFTKQNNYGVSGQLTGSHSLYGIRNQFTVGSSWDRSSLAFQQSAQFAYINPDRTLTPLNAFEDGSTTDNGVPVDSRVNLHGHPQTWSVYAIDTLSVGSGWNFTVSGRYNRTTIDNRDRINPGGGPGSLDGQYVFDRFNPSAGVTFSPNPFLNLYGSYSESSRAPTSIELGCADPNNPCNLPNALTSDPPLQQVVTKSVEAGVRSGAGESRLTWSAGWFRASNHNDLLFVTNNQTGNGYFKNFGRTLREGIEVHLSGRIQRFTLGGNYTFLNATYQSPEALNGSSNSASDAALAGSPGLGGVIQIQPGDRIPLVPQHMIKAFADAQITRKISADVDFVAVSSSYARGNENNQSVPDGIYYLGPGTSPGYGMLNLGARYQVRKQLQVFAQINNVLDHHYYTAAQLSVTGFSNQGTFLARPLPPVNGNYPLVSATFYAPGAPIGAWGGIRITF